MAQFKSQAPAQWGIMGATSTLGEVRSNLLVNQISQIITAHILSSDIRPANQDTWQAWHWLRFMSEKAYDHLGEIILNGMVYGQAIVDIVESVDSQGHRVVKDIVPLDMQAVRLKYVNASKPESDIQAYECWYYNAPLDMRYIRNLVFYTEGGKPYPFGRRIGTDCKRLEEAKEFQSFGVKRGAAGQYVATGEGNDEAITQYFTDMKTNAFVANVLDGWQIDALPNGTGKGEIADAFDKIIRNAENAILNAFCMGWMNASVTAPGTYGSMQAYLDSYSKFIGAWSQIIVGFYNEIARYMASRNLEEPIAIINDEIRIGKTETGFTPYEIKALLEGNMVTLDEARSMLGMQPASPELIDIRKSMLAPPPVAAKLLEMPVAGSLGEWLKNEKKQQTLAKIMDGVERIKSGQPFRFDLDQKQQLEQITGKNLILPASRLEGQTRALIKRMAKGEASPNEFDSIWNTFMEEVLNG